MKRYLEFINEKVDWNWLLMNSAICNDLEGVKKALKNGADIHANGDYALRWASYNGHLEMVKYLVKKDIGVTAKNHALQWASDSGHLEIIEYLVKKGADIHADNDTALLAASEKGHLEVVKYFIQQNANVHAKNDYALRWASLNGHLEVVKYLVEHGADIHADEDQSLRATSDNGHLEIVKYLCEWIIQNEPWYIPKIMEYIPEDLKEKYAHLFAANDMDLL